MAHRPSTVEQNWLAPFADGGQGARLLSTSLLYLHEAFGTEGTISRDELLRLVADLAKPGSPLRREAVTVGDALAAYATGSGELSGTMLAAAEDAARAIAAKLSPADPRSVRVVP